MDLLLNQDWTNFDPNQPRSYYFEGGGVWHSLLLIITIFLLIYVFIISTIISTHISRNFVITLLIPIAVNIVPRIVKNIYLYIQSWPNVYILYVLTTIELTFYLTLHLNLIGNIIIYTCILLKHIKENKCIILWFPFVFILIVSVTTSTLYFNFNKPLAQIPFYIFFFLLWILTFISIVIFFIMAPIIICIYGKKRLEVRNEVFWTYAFITFAAIPHIYCTAAIFTDFFFELSGASDPGNYVASISNRILAFSIQPVFILVATLVTLPLYRKHLLFFRKNSTAIDVIDKKHHTVCIKAKQQGITENPEQVAVQTSLSTLLTKTHPSEIPMPSNQELIVRAGGLEQLNPLFFPGAMPSDTNRTVIRGELHRLDPDIYPGASIKPCEFAEVPATVTVIITPKNINQAFKFSAVQRLRPK